MASACGRAGADGGHAEGTARCLRMTVTASSISGALGVGELGDVAFDAVDEPPDAGDLLLGGGGVGAGPLVDAVDGGGEPFAGAEQVIEVGGQVGQVGDVGAEVVAAGAAEPDRAGAAAGRDVGRLGAGPVGDGDLADRVPGVLGFQQGAGVAPDPVAVPVEAHRGDLVDRVAAAVFADPVIAAGDVQVPVIKELGEHVDGHAGVGVPLGVGVPVGIRDDLGGVEGGAVAGAQRPEALGPFAVPPLEHVDGHGPAPVRVAPRGGQQPQLGRRGAGEPGADTGLLAGDHRRGGLADRQAAAQPVGLGVVVDQHGGAVFVAGQAVQRQAEDVLGPPPGVDGDLGGGPDLRWLQGVQAGAQHGHDLRWQVASRLAAHGLGGDVADPDGEVAGQPGGGLPGTGQAQRADPGQDGAGAPADDVAVVAADRPCRFQVAEPVEEVLDVGPAQRGREVSVVGPAAQAFRQPRQRVDLRPDVGGAAAAVARQVLGRPVLSGLAQPGLADAGERQAPGMAEDRQVPDVLGLFAGRIGQGPADVPRQRAAAATGWACWGHGRDVTCLDRGDLLAAQRPACSPAGQRR